MPNADPVVRRALAGLAGGALGTLAMSPIMLVAGQADIMGRQPPRRLVDRLTAITPADLDSETERDLASSSLHVLIGAASGAVAAELAGATRLLGRGDALALAAGAGFGLALWAMAYAGIAPAIELLPRPSRDHPGRQASLLLAHLVYGSVTGLVARRLSTA